VLHRTCNKLSPFSPEGKGITSYSRGVTESRPSTNIITTKAEAAAECIQVSKVLHRTCNKLSPFGPEGKGITSYSRDVTESPSRQTNGSHLEPEAMTYQNNNPKDPINRSHLASCDSASTTTMTNTTKDSDRSSASKAQLSL